MSGGSSSWSDQLAGGGAVPGAGGLNNALGVNVGIGGGVPNKSNAQGPGPGGQQQQVPQQPQMNGGPDDTSSGNTLRHLHLQHLLQQQVHYIYFSNVMFYFNKMLFF